VKNKNRINLILFLSCFLTGFFVFASKISAEKKSIIFNEVLVGTSDSSRNEFIELYNSTDEAIDLTGFKLKKKLNKQDSKESSLISSSNFIGEISAHGYFLITTPEYRDLYNADLIYSGKSYSVTADNTILLYDKDEALVDSLSYIGENKNYSYSFSDGEWFWSSSLTPDKENSKKPELKSYSNNIMLNEIFPYPPKGQEEFIELYNPEEKDADLYGWILRDESKTGKYVFPENTSIKSQAYLVVYKENFKFALNNSGAESVTLFSPDEKIVSTVSYTGAKENISYNFNGQSWRWSKFLTPNAENVFNNLPRVKNDVPKKAYKNMYADFSAQGKDADKDKLKYTWDFGDGHKSYKKETRHKYAKTGQYTVTLKISDGSEDTIKTFGIIVKKFPELDVNIVGLSANPSGVDTGNEWIKIKNKSKKKINLKDWSIATGDKKKLVNHPIISDLVIKSGKELTLTHTNSKFTLNNTASKIELRYPTGKVASKIAYKSPAKSIAEDATYEKTKLGWVWKNQTHPSTVPATNTTLLATTEPIQKITPPQKNLEQLSQELEIIENIGKFSPSPEFETKKKTRFSLINFGLHIQTASAFSEEKSTPTKDYFSTSEFPARKHWLTKLRDDLFSQINLLIGNLL